MIYHDIFEETDEGKRIYLCTAQREETESAMQLICQAKEFLHSQGIDQWQRGYPDLPCIQQDIENQKGYFLSDRENILGYLYIDFDGEPAYQELNGSWKSDGPYGVVHRLAIGSEYRGQGIANAAFRLVQKLCCQKGIHSIRIDTDEDNHRMQHILQKNGFAYCGTIWFVDSQKIAFEKIF